MRVKRNKGKGFSMSVDILGPSINFQATLAGVNTAARPVSFGIDGDAKVSLETDQSQAGAIVSLLALGGSLLDVTVRVIPGAVVVAKPKGKRKKADAAI